MPKRKIRPTIIALLAFAGLGAWVPDYGRSAPKDARDFINRMTQCWHWAGEEAYNKARAHEINRALKTLRCDALDREEASLRKKYQSRADILAILDRARKQYDEEGF